MQVQEFKRAVDWMQRQLLEARVHEAVNKTLVERVSVSPRAKQSGSLQPPPTHTPPPRLVAASVPLYPRTPLIVCRAWRRTLNGKRCVQWSALTLLHYCYRPTPTHLGAPRALPKIRRH